MSNSQTDYGGYEGFILQLRNLPAIESADLERAAFVALQHLHLLRAAADALAAYRAGETGNKAYDDVDFVVDVAAIVLQFSEFDLPFHGDDALATVELLLASTNAQPIRMGHRCNNSANRLVWDAADVILDFARQFHNPPPLGIVMDALKEAFVGPSGCGIQLLGVQANLFFGENDTTPIRDAALTLNAEAFAEDLEQHLMDWDQNFVEAKVELEFARAAAYLHLMHGRSCGVPPKDARPPRLVIEGETVMLDGKPVPLDMTAERRREAIFYLKSQLEAKGNWLTDGEIERRQKGLPGSPGGEFAGVRWDHVRDQLPGELRALIQTEKRKGSRLILSPPPRRRLRK